MKRYIFDPVLERDKELGTRVDDAPDEYHCAFCGIWWNTAEMTDEQGHLLENDVCPYCGARVI